MPSPPYVLDLCAGIGGWSVALRERNLVDLPVENNRHARAALAANALDVYHDDVTTLLGDRARRIWLRHAVAGVVGSTPCQPFSQANPAARGIDDPRALLVRSFRDVVVELRPPFACLENVPKGTGDVFDEVVEDLAAAGYTAEHRVVCAADYGDGQARHRRLLVARRDGRPVLWPEPTHADPATRAGAASIADGTRKPWATLADVLPDRTDLPYWAGVRPSTTVVGSFRPEVLAPPTYRRPGDGPRQNQPNAVVASVDERLTIQGFPAGWRTAGPPTAQGLQVGNAIPPTLARVALSAALD